MSSQEAAPQYLTRSPSSVLPPVLLFLPGIADEPHNTSARIAELMAIKATRGPGAYAVEDIPGPSDRLSNGKRIIKVGQDPKLDVYMVDYRPRLQVPDVAGDGLGTALRRTLFALWYFLRALALVLRASNRAKTGTAKWQLVIGFGAAAVLLLAAILAILAVLTALGLWLEPVAADTAADAIAIGMTAVFTWLFVRLRPVIRETASLLQQLLDYAEDERHNAGVTAILGDALDDLIEEDPDRSVYLLAYSLGALVAIDYLYPRAALGERPDPRHVAVKKLVTVGCPTDFVRLFIKNYLDDRLPRVPSLRWFNIFIPADVLGSNFNDGSDTAVQGTETVTVADERPVSKNYTNHELTFRNIWGREGFLSHGGYWDEPERENCLHLVMSELEVP